VKYTMFDLLAFIINRTMSFVSFSDVLISFYRFVWDENISQFT